MHAIFVFIRVERFGRPLYFHIPAFSLLHRNSADLFRSAPIPFFSIPRRGRSVVEGIGTCQTNREEEEEASRTWSIYEGDALKWCQCNRPLFLPSSTSFEPYESESGKCSFSLVHSKRRARCASESFSYFSLSLSSVVALSEKERGNEMEAGSSSGSSQTASLDSRPRLALSQKGPIGLSAPFLLSRVPLRREGYRPAFFSLGKHGLLFNAALGILFLSFLYERIEEVGVWCVVYRADKRSWKKHIREDPPLSSNSGQRKVFSSSQWKEMELSSLDVSCVDAASHQERRRQSTSKRTTALD